VGGDPLGHHLPDDGLRAGPHDQRFLKFLASGVGDDRELGGKTLDVLGLAAQIRLGDQQREVGVLVPGVLDAAVELGLK
jgi:hypothetical protein